MTRAVNWAAPSAAEKNVDLKSELHAEDSLVLGQPDALQSVLGNLLSNAIRDTPAGGTVTVVTLAGDERS